MGIESMTGYGEATGEGLRVEARSVNCRSLEVYFKIPHFLMPYEPKMRTIVREYFQRGRLDIFVSFTEEANLQIEINRSFAGEVIKTMKSLKEDFDLEAPLGIEPLYWFKDFVFKQEVRFQEDALYKVLKEAMERLKEMRKKEGSRLREFLLEGIESMGRITEAIEARVEPVEVRYRRLREKIKGLAFELDEGRLYQEAVLIADRADITEELQRLKSHREEFLQTLQGSNSAIGKKLDFILQECLREFNTLQAKATSAEIVHLAISAKGEIEKLREQVQNVQ